MELKEFIPILECALKCSDESIVEVSQNPANDNEIRVFLDVMVREVAVLPLELEMHLY